MDRAIPCGNKVCMQRVQQRSHDLHRERVRKIKAIVDTKEPAANHMDHVRLNLKKEQQLEDKYSEIDRENRCLLQKNVHNHEATNHTKRGTATTWASKLEPWRKETRTSSHH